jgi:uncharacterized protein (TIGR03000 family)
MYSVVLATMLTAGAQTTTWCHRSGCHGCHGCHYNAFSVCSGCHSYCSGCYGGCYGGGCWCSGVSRCHGCGGGWGCSGCWSSCSGSWSSCHGCFGGVVVNGCSGCHGPAVVVQDGGGGAGGAERVGRPRADAPSNEAERQAVEDLLRRMREQKKRERKRDDEEVSAAPARVVVKLPASARLWVDQVACPLEGTERSFDTPALEPGQRYVYTLRVELERDGRRAEETRRVPLVAGQRVEVDFESVGAVRTAAN